MSGRPWEEADAALLWMAAARGEWPGAATSPTCQGKRNLDFGVKSHILNVRGSFFKISSH